MGTTQEKMVTAVGGSGDSNDGCGNSWPTVLVTDGSSVRSRVGSAGSSW